MLSMPRAVKYHQHRGYEECEGYGNRHFLEEVPDGRFGHRHIFDSSLSLLVCPESVYPFKYYILPRYFR